VKPPPEQVLDSVSLAAVLLGQRDDSQPVRQTLLVQSSPFRDALQDGGYFNGNADPSDAELMVVKAQEKAMAQEKRKMLAELKRQYGETPLRDTQAHALIEGDWKLVIDIFNQPAALYKLDEDFSEASNVIADPSHAGRVKDMIRKYLEIRQSARSVPVLQ
jgi:hypothetical protein